VKKSVLFVFLLLYSAITFAQQDTLHVDNKRSDRYGIWLIPSASENIYGLAIGLVGSEAICNRPYTKKSHGINIQIPGQGFFQTFYINKIHYSDFVKNNPNSEFFYSGDSIPQRALHNGLLVSVFGTFTDQINGLSVSSWMSMGRKINGVSINLLWNVYKEVNGLVIALVNHAGTVNGAQVGIVNKSNNLRGVQIGLWNKNSKRSLPLINWNFTK
jgi:hypothetical protein